MAASAKANKTRYDKKTCGAVPVVGDRVLLRNVSIRGKNKLASKCQDDVFMIVGQVDQSILVYQIQRESGSGDVKTVHRNLLLPLSLPLDPQITPVLPINKNIARIEEPPTLSLQSDDDDDDWVFDNQMLLSKHTFFKIPCHLVRQIVMDAIGKNSLKEHSYHY